jgi:transcriptional regulator with XRE-family HTH domain
MIMDATERIKELLKQRGWTAYKLSKQSGLAESTVNNILKRNTVPSVTTLESICGGFGMTMAQFFAEGELIEVTPDVSELVRYYTVLSSEQKELARELLKKMNMK